MTRQGENPFRALSRHFLALPEPILALPEATVHGTETILHGEEVARRGTDCFRQGENWVRQGMTTSLSAAPDDLAALRLDFRPVPVGAQRGQDSSGKTYN